MNLDEQIGQISESLHQLQVDLDQATPTAPNPDLRQFMEAMSRQLQEGRAQFADVYKSGSAKIDELLANLKTRSRSLADQVGAARAKLAAPPTPKLASTPAVPAFIVDPDLGQKLRQELLDRFAPDQPEPEQRAWEAGRAAWDDWAEWSQN